MGQFVLAENESHITRTCVPHLSAVRRSRRKGGGIQTDRQMETAALYYSRQRMTRQDLGSETKNDTVMSFKLVVGKHLLNIISAYAPLTG